MKHILGFLLLFICSFTFIGTLHAQEYSPYTWYVDSFHSNITINEDSSFTVEEQIMVDFQQLQRRGILRNIPVDYKDNLGGNYSIRLNVESVTTLDGQARPFTVYKEGDFKVIRVGDPDIYISGPQQYVLTYTVANAYTIPSENIIEFFWNVTGEWYEAPIEEGSVTYSIPFLSSEDFSQLEAICFTGSYGSTTKDCSIEKNTANKEVSIKANTYVGHGQLSAAIKFPSTSLTLPGVLQKAQWFAQDNWILVFPFLVLVFMIIQWFRSGKDLSRGPIVTQYTPPADMTPAEIGLLVDDKIHRRDVSALIIQLAIEGYLRIEENSTKKLLWGSNKEYTFYKLKDYPTNNTPKHMQKFFKEFFDKKEKISTKELRESLPYSMTSIHKSIKSDIKKKNFYITIPSEVRETWIAIAIVVGFIGLMVGGTMEHIPMIIASLSTAVIMALFGYIMPKKTKKGQEMFEYVLGLREYIAMAEKDYLAFINAPERTTDQFEKILPYAIALGVEDAWARAFENIYPTPPSWYNSNIFNDQFQLGDFLSSFNDMNRAVSSSLGSKSHYSSSGGSGFSGGGFSGGGFGGGGGGSW